MSVHDWRKLSTQRDELVLALRGLADRLEGARTVEELDRLMRWQIGPTPPASARKEAA